LPAKNAVKYSTTGGEGVSAKKYVMMLAGHVLMEPRYYSTACSRNMALALLATAVAVS